MVHLREERESIEVAVPQRLLHEFYAELSTWLRSEKTPAHGAPASSTPDVWQKATLSIPRARVEGFYAFLGAFLPAQPAEATPPTKQLTRKTVVENWAKLRTVERELVLLLIDGARAIPWTTLQGKLGLPAKPSLERDFPVLTQLSRTHAAAMPVRIDGTDDPALLIDDAYFQIFKHAATVNR
jgi:hypothetical protein